jgi:hypothetical protein
MSTFGQGNNTKYLVHVIAVKCLLEQKGTDQDGRKDFQVVVEDKKELEFLPKAQDNETEVKKEEQKKKPVKIKKNLKTASKLAVTEALKPYKLFHCSVIGKARTGQDKIVHKTHSKDPWVGVNSKSHKGQRPSCAFLAVFSGLH